MELGKNIFEKIDSIDLRHSMLFYLYKSILPNGSMNILLKKQIYFLVKCCCTNTCNYQVKNTQMPLPLFREEMNFKKKGIVIDRFK